MWIFVRLSKLELIPAHRVNQQPSQKLAPKIYNRRHQLKYLLIKQIIYPSKPVQIKP